MRRAPSPRRLAGLVLAVGLAGTLTPAPAQAAPGSPPVAADDKVTLRFGQPRAVDVLANDSDPDGDDLAVCRLGPVPARLQVFPAEDGELFVAPTRRIRSGTFTFTYYACDFEFLVPATVTVTVTPAPDIKVRKMPARPGFLRVKNTARFTIGFLYGSRRAEQPDGTLTIPAKEARFVRVHRPRIFWIAVTRRGGLIDSGLVRNIDLRRAVAAPATPTLTSRERETWHRSVSG